MDLFNTALLSVMLLFTPLLLLFWVVLLAGVGQWLYEGVRNLGQPHSPVEARIIDERKIDTRIHGNRTSWIGVRSVYLLRYEFAGATYEIEYLVRHEPQVMLDRDARTFKLYVPHHQPAHARAEYHPSQLIYGFLLVAAMAYGTWMVAPFLLFWK